MYNIPKGDQQTMYKSFSYAQIFDLCKEIFKSYGYDEEDSKQIADVVISADLSGVESHGISRMIKYHQFIQNGAISTKAKPELVFETPISAVYDAHKGIGQLVSARAMQEAITKAKKTGIGLVQVRNSNHYGIAGYYSAMAAKEDLMGICMTNSVSIMVPTFGSEAMLGSNPIALAMPADPTPFLFDASTTVVTRGKIEVYHKQEKPLPDGWAVDEKGKTLSAPDKLLKNISNSLGGGILPLGGYGEENSGYKGYGFGMICEILSSVLSGGVPSNHKTDDGDTSHCFYAVDYGIFGEKEKIRSEFSAFLNEVRGAKKASGCNRIYIPGEKELESQKLYKEKGIQMNQKTFSELKMISEMQGISSELFE